MRNPRSHVRQIHELRFEKATVDDIPKLTENMTRVFNNDTRRFRGKPEEGSPPGYDDGSFLMKWGLTGNGQYPLGSFYKILIGAEKRGKPAGVFIVFVGEKVGKPGNNVLGTILVDPEWQNRGIGSKALQYIFTTFPAKRWKLGTTEWARRNHHFYEKNGFVKIREVWDPELDKEKGGVYSYIYERVMRN
ncbi:MAG: GNAT family N-acetyltransferase [Candidatus Bathyarchaeota archaeon]|nr:GNAT family N-acetyltransferase [Candidatus Bathyarchaeota archaeon]MDH5788389.1 GNAT family N-acetyltransferase [Candidatus Bathyarchaeota archaeon]